MSLELIGLIVFYVVYVPAIFYVAWRQTWPDYRHKPPVPKVLDGPMTTSTDYTGLV